MDVPRLLNSIVAALAEERSLIGEQDNLNMLAQHHARTELQVLGRER
jgi:hypothetical protein